MTGINNRIFINDLKPRSHDSTGSLVSRSSIGLSTISNKCYEKDGTLHFQHSDACLNLKLNGAESHM